MHQCSAFASGGGGDEHEVIERWAWMSYAVRSLLEELRDKGVAVLVGGPVT